MKLVAPGARRLDEVQAIRRHLRYRCPPRPAGLRKHRHRLIALAFGTEGELDMIHSAALQRRTNIECGSVNNSHVSRLDFEFDVAVGRVVAVRIGEPRPLGRQQTGSGQGDDADRHQHRAQRCAGPDQWFGRNYGGAGNSTGKLRRALYGHRGHRARKRCRSGFAPELLKEIDPAEDLATALSYMVHPPGD